MSKVSFEGIGEIIATFAADSSVKEGQVVKTDGDGKVKSCSAADRICGVVTHVKDGYAAVQIGGVGTLPYSGSGVAAGWVKLVADGTGGVRVAAAANGNTAAEDSREYLVLSVDTAGKLAAVLL